MPILLLAACAFAGNAAAASRPGPIARTVATLLGKASWHGGNGDRTASGERWRSEELIAAHRTFPLGSKVRVVNVRTGRFTVVRITDRGPYVHGRIIDLSRAAARAIGILDGGVGQVRLETLSPEEEGNVQSEQPSRKRPG